MDKIAELRAKRAKAVEAYADLVELMAEEDYDLDGETEDETQLELLKSEIASLDAKIERTEEANKLKATLAKPVEAATPAPAMSVKVSSPGYRGQKLVSFKGPNAEGDAFASGMFFVANYAKSEKERNKAARWCNEHGIVVKYGAEGINTAGGFLVPTQFESGIIDIREEFGTFRQNARVLTMSSDSMTIPRRASGLTAYFTGENTSITESQKGWDQVVLTAKKLAVLTRLSTELAEDAAINVADDLAREIGYAFAVAEDAAGWTGDGTSTYGGIAGFKTKFVAGLSSFIGAVDLASGHDTIAEVDLTDINKVMTVLPRYAQPNAKFYMNMQMWAGSFERLSAAVGGNTIQTLSGAVPRSFLGYPVVIDQTLPGRDHAQDLSDVPMFYFGDLGMAAKMGTRRGITVKVSEDRYLEYDQIAIQATERFDVVVHDIGDATSAGPLVAAMGE